MNDMKDAVSLADRVSRCEHGVQELAKAGMHLADGGMSTNARVEVLIAAMRALNEQLLLVHARLQVLENGVTIAE